MNKDFFNTSDSNKLVKNYRIENIHDKICNFYVHFHFLCDLLKD